MWIKRIETDRWMTIIAPEAPQWQDFTTRLSGEWIDVGVTPDHDDEIQWGFRTYRAFWPEVSAALRRIFGEDGDPQPRADVLVRWPAVAMAQGWRLARAWELRRARSTLRASSSSGTDAPRPPWRPSRRA